VPQQVSWSLGELDAVKQALDREVGSIDSSIHSWHVDVTSNSIIVEAADPESASVDRFVGALGAAGAIVRVVPSAEQPHPVYTTRGGDEYIINGNTLCSVGFAVQGGFVTAGHCGGVGSPTYGSNWVAQGTFIGSTFPTHDYAWVQTNGNWDVQGNVNNYNGGGTVAVAGSNVAAVNSSICRSGRTTGWRCGTLQAKDVTVNYPQGQVYSMTKTNACVEGGDSGGSYISGNQAQGVTSGGSGNCSVGGTSFYQPLNPILSVYGLSLKTSGGGGVVFYQDINYGGAATSALPKGNYASNPGGVPNDWMSSLRVPAGWTVQAFEHGGFGGAVCTFSGDTSWVGAGCNDKMSSFKIY
jgi:streptogrisin C